MPPLSVGLGNRLNPLPAKNADIESSFVCAEFAVTRASRCFFPGIHVRAFGTEADSVDRS
jgi:hypothetical protein